MPTYANSAYTEGSQTAARKGLWPRQYDIPAGTYLYRFIDLTKAPSLQAADGPWWFEFEHFRAIQAFAEQHGYSLGYTARMFAAILYEWSEVNAYVRARVVKGPLMAWKGKGKQVSATTPEDVAKAAAKGKVLKIDPRDVKSQHGIITGGVAGSARAPAPTAKMTPAQGPLEVLQLFIPGLGYPHYKFGELMKFDSMTQIESRLP